MAIQAKSHPQTRIQTLGKYQQSLPRLPDAVIKRFGEMAEWQREMDKWWESVRDKLSERDADFAESINSNSNSIAALEEEA